MLKHNLTSDMEIMSMIEQNDQAGWKSLYDKYALTMYVGVLWVVDDEIFAKNILTHLFNYIKTDKTLLCTKKTLCASLLHYTYATTYRILKANNSMVIKKRKHHEAFSMFDNLVYKSYALNVPKRKGKGIENGFKWLYSDINHTRKPILQKNNIEKANITQEDAWHLTMQNEEGMVFKVLN